MNEKRKILFIGGVPATMGEAALEQHFSKHCEVVKVRIMREKKTREPKGFAFVTLADASMVPKMLCIDHIIEGRKVDVQLASRKGEKKDWKEEQKKRRIFVSNLPSGMGNEDLSNHFSKFGKVRNAYIIRDFLTDKSKNYGYVEFQDPEVVHAVFEQQMTIDDQPIKCMPYVGRHEPKVSPGIGRMEENKSLSEVCYTIKQKTLEVLSQEQEKEAAHRDRQELKFDSVSSKMSRFEFIGVSSRICQDESNYCFRIVPGFSGSNRDLVGQRNLKIFYNSSLGATDPSKPKLQKEDSFNSTLKITSQLKTVHQQSPHQKKAKRSYVLF